MNKSNGFTLIELLITIAVVTTLLAVGIPAMSQFGTSSRIVTASNDMVYMVTLARSEAVKQNKTTLLIKKSPTGATLAATDWSKGAVLYVDEDGSGTVNTGDTIVHQLPPQKSGIEIKLLAGNATNPLKFLPRGVLDQQGGTYQFGICSDSSDIDVSRERVLSIGLSGRPSVAKATTDPCA